MAVNVAELGVAVDRPPATPRVRLLISFDFSDPFPRFCAFSVIQIGILLWCVCIALILITNHLFGLGLIKDYVKELVEERRTTEKRQRRRWRRSRFRPYFR